MDLPVLNQWTVCGLGDDEGETALDAGYGRENGEVIPYCSSPPIRREQVDRGSFVFEGEERP